MKRFTVIWMESIQSGSHRTNITKCSRIEQTENETVMKCVERYGINRNWVVFIFLGWPLFEGQIETDVIESKLEQ